MTQRRSLSNCGGSGRFPDGPIDNVVRVIERKGVAVFRSELASDNAKDSSNVDAFSWTQGPRPLVVLGTEKDVYEWSRLDAAHELGHILLHRAHPPSPRTSRWSARPNGSGARF